MRPTRPRPRDGGSALADAAQPATGAGVGGSGDGAGGGGGSGGGGSGGGGGGDGCGQAPGSAATAPTNAGARAGAAAAARDRRAARGGRGDGSGDDEDRGIQGQARSEVRESRRQGEGNATRAMERVASFEVVRRRRRNGETRAHRRCLEQRTLGKLFNVTWALGQVLSAVLIGVYGYSGVVSETHFATRVIFLFGVIVLPAWMLTTWRVVRDVSWVHERLVWRFGLGMIAGMCLICIIVSGDLSVRLNSVVFALTLLQVAEVTTLLSLLTLVDRADHSSPSLEVPADPPPPATLDLA